MAEAATPSASWAGTECSGFGLAERKLQLNGKGQFDLPGLAGSVALLLKSITSNLGTAPAPPSDPEQILGP